MLKYIATRLSMAFYLLLGEMSVYLCHDISILRKKAEWSDW